MPAQWPSPLWTDGDHTVAAAVSLPVFKSPIPGVKAKYSFTQDFQMALASYAPTALNTAHPSTGKTPDYSSYLLCEESELRDLGGGIVRWARTYAVPPQAWDDWETYAYNVIGKRDPTSLIVLGGRHVENLPCRVRRDYFLATGSAGNVSVTLQDGSSYTLTGGAVVSAGTISRNRATLYLAPLSGVFNIGNLSEYVTGTTLPAYDDYADQITDAETNGWGATVYEQVINVDGDVTESNHGGQLTAEDSRLTRWLGNIWCRETRYVLAL